MTTLAERMEQIAQQLPAVDGAASAGAKSQLELLSEDDAAKHFVHVFGDDVRYCAAAGGWLLWDGRRFAPDVDNAILRRASENTDHLLERAEAIDDLKERAKFLIFITNMRRARSLKSVVELASSKMPIAVGSPEQFDSFTHLLNVRNGTLSLRTGQLRPHARTDLHTKLMDVDYDPNATAPRWERCLQEIFNGDAELIAFFARAVGYSLTADTSEHVFFVLWGRGANGKSTIVEALLHLLGDYAQSSDSETWLKQPASRGADPGIARLPGIRMVAVPEIAEGRRLDEARVKKIVSGDRTTCRQLYCPEFDFIPSCKLWFLTNFVPEIRGTDDGIWRRVLLVPFTQQFTGEACDPQLGDKLRAELPGILSWAIRGALEWAQLGLRPPASVQKATASYRAQSDIVGQFLSDECVTDLNYTVAAGEIYSAYRAWSERMGEKAMSNTAFGRRLGDAGYRRTRGARGGKSWSGITLSKNGEVSCV